MSILRSKHSGWTWEGRRTPFGGGSGGGGGPTQTTAYQTNLPEYARPYVETMLGAAQKQAFTTKEVGGTPDVTTQIGTDESGQPIFQTTPGTPGRTEITGFRPYVPYGATVDASGRITNTAQEQAAAAVAGFSPMQEQAFQGIAGLEVPGQFEAGSQLVGASGMGALQASRQAQPLMQGAFKYGDLGTQYGAQGAGYGAQGASIGAQGRDIGVAGGARYGGMGVQAGQAGQQLGVQGGGYYGGMGADYGGAAAGMSGMGFGAGQRFEQMATSPGAQRAFMSPYMQNVVDWQKEQAIRDYNINRQAEQARAVGAGAFGGSRQAVAQAEGNRALMNQLAGIQATGTQKAFEDAQRQMQFGADLGLRGLGAGYQGLGLGIQGAQTGLQGVGQQLAGTAQGMQGAQIGLQGVGQQLAGTAQGLQGAGLGIQGAQAGMQGAGLGLQGVGQAIAAGQFGLQGLSQATQAGAALGNIGAQQLQAQQGILGLQAQMGAQEQALEQQRINQAIQNYAMQQQYPMQQLSMMSSLLRGLPLQSATTQSYQAPPSAISQLGGLGAAGIGLYGMGRTAGAFKEGGVVKMASGGITGLSKKVLMNPESFSAKQIDDMTKKGMISKLVGVPVLDAKMKDEQRMKMSQAAQQPRPVDTIAQDVMARAAAQGIDNAPSNLPVMSAFDGGIVAMAGGGEVEENPGIVKLNGGGSAFMEDVNRFREWAKEPGINEAIIKKLREAGSYFTKPRQSTMSPGDVEVQPGYTPSSAPAPFPAEPAKPRFLPDDSKTSAAAATPALTMPESTVDLSGKGITDILKKFQEGQATSAAKDVEDKKMAFWSSLAQFGLGAMAGTSPYGGVNIGQAGVPAVKSGMESLRDIRAREEKRGIADLQAALEGEKIKADLSKLGIMEPYYRSGAIENLAKARYYDLGGGKGTGTAGMGSVPFGEFRKIKQEYQGYLTDGKTVLASPLARYLDKDTKDALGTKVGSPSYERGMARAAEIARQRMDADLREGMQYSAKQRVASPVEDR